MALRNDQNFDRVGYITYHLQQSILVKFQQITYIVCSPCKHSFEHNHTTKYKINALFTWSEIESNYNITQELNVSFVQINIPCIFVSHFQTTRTLLSKFGWTEIHTT